MFVDLHLSISDLCLHVDLDVDVLSCFGFDVDLRLSPGCFDLGFSCPNGLVGLLMQWFGCLDMSSLCLVSRR